MSLADQDSWTLNLISWQNWFLELVGLQSFTKKVSNFYNHLLNYGVIKKIDLRLTMCLLDMLSWCQHKVHFWYKKLFFLSHNVLTKKSVSLFFCFTSRAKRVVLLTSLDLLLTFTGEYYWRGTEALGYYYLRTLLLFFRQTTIHSYFSV